MYILKVLLPAMTGNAFCRWLISPRLNNSLHNNLSIAFLYRQLNTPDPAVAASFPSFRQSYRETQSLH
jgi:hypothetical protein